MYWQDYTQVREGNQRTSRSQAIPFPRQIAPRGQPSFAIPTTPARHASLTLSIAGPLPLHSKVCCGHVDKLSGSCCTFTSYRTMFFYHMPSRRQFALHSSPAPYCSAHARAMSSSSCHIWTLSRKFLSHDYREGEVEHDRKDSREKNQPQHAMPVWINLNPAIRTGHYHSQDVVGWNMTLGLVLHQAHMQ